MDLEALRAFVAVVDTGSLVAAARTLNLARATLRRRVGELEASAGVALLRRSQQGAVATEAGAVLAERGRSILGEARVLLSQVREVGAEPAGELRLVLPVGLPPQFLLPLVRRLERKHPRLAVRLRFADDPVAGLLGDVDVAVHFGARKPDGPFTSFALLEVHEWLIASQGYLARAGTPRTVAELAGHRLLAWDGPGTDARRWPLLRGGELAVEPALISSDIHLLRLCAAAGMGIALVPDARLEETRPPAERLVPVLAQRIGRERSLRVVAPTALIDIPRIRVVLDELRGLVKPRRRGA